MASRHSLPLALVACALLAPIGCDACDCEGVRDKVTGVATGGGDDDGDDDTLRDAVRDGDEDAVRDSVGHDVDAPVAFEIDRRELTEGEPKQWLGRYIKYRQMLWSRMYTTDRTMCTEDAAGEPNDGPPPVAEDLGELAEQLEEAGKRDLDRLLQQTASFEGTTALHMAAFFCKPDIAEMLIDEGATVEAPDGADMTPLHWTSCGEVVETLCEADADPNAESDTGLTPLHVAADRHVVAALLACGAEVDVRDRCGNTPLHMSNFFGLRFEDFPETPDGGKPADLSDAPTWVRVLVRVVDGLASMGAYIAGRFDVHGALVDAGADTAAENGAGSTPNEARLTGGGGDWDD